MLEDYYRLYGFVLMLSVVAVIVPTSMVLVSWLFQRLRVRPSKPDPVKSEIYECGMETIGGRWVPVQLPLLPLRSPLSPLRCHRSVHIPWAIRLKTLGPYALLELMAFVGILTLGWAYAWRKGALEWR